MKIQPIQPQLLAALHLVEESLPRLLQRIRIRVSEINQITVVRQYLSRRVPEFLAAFFEQCDTPRGQRCRLPLPLVLREQGKSRRPDLVGVQRRVLHSSRCTHVRSYILFHSLFFIKMTRTITKVLLFSRTTTFSNKKKEVYQKPPSNTPTPLIRFITLLNSHECKTRFNQSD